MRASQLACHDKRWPRGAEAKGGKSGPKDYTHRVELRLLLCGVGQSCDTIQHTDQIDFVLNFSVTVQALLGQWCHNFQKTQWDRHKAYAGTPCLALGFCVPNSGQCGLHLCGQPIGIMGERFSRKRSCGSGHRHMLQDSRINTRHQGAFLQSRWGVLASFSGLGAYGKCLGHLGLLPMVKKLGRQPFCWVKIKERHSGPSQFQFHSTRYRQIHGLPLTLLPPSIVYDRFNIMPCKTM